MIDKNIQLMVGPTAMPERIQKALCHPSFSHRGEYYYGIQKEVCDGMRNIFKTTNDILSLTCSGTGSIEAVIQNLFRPGDKIVIPISGSFGELIYDVAAPYELDITRVDFDYGKTCDVDEVMKYVDEDTRAVLMVHNESTTGILNDIEAFGRALKDTDTLMIVDAVSSAAGVDIQMDEWGIDIVLTTSQKALMSPPGLAFVALSDKAWEKVYEVNNQKYYFNFTKDRQYIHNNRTVHTPATHTLLAVREALKMLEEEGYENVLQRHIDNAAYVRSEVLTMDLELIDIDTEFASPALVCVKVPGKSQYYIDELAKRNIIVGGGKRPINEDTFRVGTMGYVSNNDLIAMITNLKEITARA